MQTVCHASGRRHAFATLALFLLFAVGLAAQDQSSATLNVVVAPGAAVVVEVQSLDDPKVTRTISPDPTRPATMRALPPGRYRVVVSGAGETPATTEVHLDPGEIVSLEVTLASAGGALGIRVADRFHAGEAVVLREPKLTGMPSSGHLWSLIDALVPWTLVDVIDNGGIGTGRRGLFGVRDASWTWNSFVMDGIDLTDPDRPGTPLQYPDVKALQAVSVTSGLAPAEVSASGAQVTLVPRRPGASFHGGFEIAGTTDRMVSKRLLTVAPPVARIQSWGDVNAQVGGPVSERVGLFLAGRATRSEVVERGRAPARSTDVASLFGHVVARPTDRDEVRVVWSAQAIKGPLEGGDTFLGRDVDERNTFWQSQVHWDRVTSGGTTSSLAVGFQRGAFAPEVDALTIGGVVDRAHDGAVPSPVSRRVSRRVDARVGIGLPARRVGSTWHALRFDLALNVADATSHVLTSPDVAERAGGVPSRVWQFDVPATDPERRSSQIAGAVADEIRLGDYVTFDAGVRFERWHGRAVGAPGAIEAFTVAPRLAGRANFGTTGVAAFGAWGRYRARPSLQWLAFGDPSEAQARLYRWSDPNADGAFDATERGAPLALAGWGGSLGSIDPDLRMPTTTEYVIGGEVRRGAMLLRTTATIRHERSLVRAVNVGIPLSSYTRTLIPDQTDDRLMIPVFERPAHTADLDRYVLTNPDDDVLKYHGLEVLWEQAITPRWRMRASALAWWTFGPGGAPGFRVTENDQGLLGELFQDPNTISHAAGANFFDRSYVLKWSGTYEAPRDWWVSFSANYRDGQPFAGFIVLPDLNQGPEILQSYSRGRTRFTFTVLLDARIEKRFVIGGRQAALWLEAFNVPDMYEEVEEDAIKGPTFRQSTALQPPRTLRAGFRLEF